MKRGVQTVLLVEDNPGDVRLVREVLGELGFSANLQVAGDGEEAIALLRRQGPYTQAARPHLIVLDLNLPKKDGREVLAEIKADRELRRIPVVILTTSHSDEDILQAYDLHANCYLVKPIDLESVFETVRAIVNFWTERVTLPPN